MEDKGTKKRIAVVLAGAVAKGAFEAGALEVLVARDVEIVRIVAASSGALNGVVLAAGVRAGQPAAFVKTLVELWEKHATLCGGFNVKLGPLSKLIGISGPEKLLGLLRERVKASESPVNPIDLRIIVSPLSGAEGAIGEDARVEKGEGNATTFETVLRFNEHDFDNDPSLSVVFKAAVASSTFPGAFIPFDDEGDELDAHAEYPRTKHRHGPYIDGGTVNNTPIKYALGVWRGEKPKHEKLDAIVVIAPTAQHEREEERLGEGLRGVGLLARLVDMLIGERLYRDLHDAEDMNRAVANLQALRDDDTLDAEQFRKVTEAIGWSGRYSVPIVTIRPTRALIGNPFSALWKADDRAIYLQQGRDCALEAIEKSLLK